MSTYTTIQGQTIWDLSVKLYGNASNVVKLISDNPFLDYVGKLIPPGSVIQYDAPLGNVTTNFFNNRNTDPATGTGNPLQGSGFGTGFTINGHN